MPMQFPRAAEDFVEALMVTLGDTRSLSTQDTCIFLDLFMGTDAAQQILLSTTDTSGDVAACPPEMSVAWACSKRVPSPPWRLNHLRMGPQ